MSENSLSGTFLVNNRINLFLLSQLSDEQLAIASNSRARSIGDQFAHLHKARQMWLEVSDPAAAKKLPAIEKGQATKKNLREALEASGEAMAQLLDISEKSGKVKGAGKQSPVNFFAYVIAHEAHHRGQILLHLKNAGLPFDKTKSYEIWEWKKF